MVGIPLIIENTRVFLIDIHGRRWFDLWMLILVRWNVSQDSCVVAAYFVVIAGVQLAWVVTLVNQCKLLPQFLCVALRVRGHAFEPIRLWYLGCLIIWVGLLHLCVVIDLLDALQPHAHLRTYLHARKTSKYVLSRCLLECPHLIPDFFSFSWASCCRLVV